MPFQLLLVVERPDLSHPEKQAKWDDCRRNIAKFARQYTNLIALGENVLLVTIDNKLSSVRDALSCLHGMDYKYTLFDTEIQWHEISKDYEL